MASFGDNAVLNPGGTTFGQTFQIADGPAQLSSLSFAVQGYAPNLAPEPCTFEVFIMAWDSLRPVGPVLYQSQSLEMPLGFFPIVTFNLPLDEVLLRQQQEYVVFLTANNYLNGIRSDAAVATVPGSTYAGGRFVSHSPGYCFNDLLVQSWTADVSQDLAFRLNYTVVPEPSASMLLISGLIVCGVSRIVKRRPAV